MTKIGLLVFIVVIVLVVGIFTCVLGVIPAMTRPQIKAVSIAVFGYPINITIDKTLQPFLNVTLAEAAGNGVYGTGKSLLLVPGDVNWIGSPGSAITSLSNIHLLMYAKMITVQNGNSTTTGAAGFLQVSLNQPTIPNDAIGHDEAVIPTLSLSNNLYSFNLSCPTQS